MSVVEYTVEDHIATVTLNRPEARNAINPEMACLLSETWNKIKEDDNVRVAILTGAGEKSFCSGADLGTLIPLIAGLRKPEDEFDNKIIANPKIVSDALLRDIDTVKPVIAAVNGYSIAGGMEMTQGTDIRISSTSAKFGVQEVKWALFPAGGSTVRLPSQIPFAKAMELLLTGDFITPEEALSLGFLNYVVEPDQVMPKAREIAQKIAKNGPLAVKAIRKSVRASLGLEEQKALELETKLSAPIFKSKDAMEGPIAFLEKREPVFQGA